jgi:hypothetical protein
MGQFPGGLAYRQAIRQVEPDDFSHGFDTVGVDPRQKGEHYSIEKGTILYLREE